MARRGRSLLLALEPRLLAVAIRMTRNAEIARDVVQNAFEKVLLHGDRFAGESRVSTWLHRIVVNEALMCLRAARRRGEQPGTADGREIEQLRDPAADPARRAEAREAQRRLYAVLDRLPPAERDVIVHCGLRDESYASYAARSGLHPGAVKTRSFRGRRRLQALLGSA